MKIVIHGGTNVSDEVMHGQVWYGLWCFRYVLRNGSNAFLFVWFDSLRPINNFSVIKGRVFLGWTSPKLGLMSLLKDTMQWCRWGSTRGHSVSSQAFYHWATALPGSNATFVYFKELLQKQIIDRPLPEQRECKLVSIQYWRFLVSLNQCTWSNFWPTNKCKPVWLYLIFYICFSQF